MIARRPVASVFAVALLLRLAFVFWAPDEPAADGIFYRIYAENIARGWGYIDVDGSPVVRWMPGWPFFLSALYTFIGSATHVATFANALLDAFTAALLVPLGTRLFDPRTGVVAGGLYACWPGMIFLCGTHMSEPLFNLLLVGTLLATLRTTEATEGRTRRAAVTGFFLGAAALVKAEPLVLFPAIAWSLWRTRISARATARELAAMLVVTAALLTPWTIRNYVAFDRFLPTAASGGIGAHLANHPGASGGQDLFANRTLQERFRRENLAWTAIARNDAGWREAWDFARDNPREELRIVANKLRLTYLGDARGAKLVRGMGPEAGWQITPADWRTLRWTSDLYWFAMLALAAVGLARRHLGGADRRDWNPVALPLLVAGVLLPWFCLHLIMLGGPRYHVPQIPALALFAACGVTHLLERLSHRRSARTP